MKPYLKHVTLGLLALLLCLCCLPAWGQQVQPDPERARRQVYQLSGIILNRKTGEPVPFTSIRVNHGRRRSIANDEGFYSIPVVMADTIYFSCVGYKPSKLVVGDYIREYQGDKSTPYVYEIHYMAEDSITTPTVRIFAYNTPELLRTAILNMQNDPLAPNALAGDNLDPRVLSAYVNTMPVDEYERMAAARQQYYMQYRQQYTMNALPIFDPVAVARMLQNISERSRQKREKVYNYWSE